MPNSILVVNMRGTINVRKPVKATLEDLHINKRFRATIVPDNPIYRGMLKLAKDRVAWSTVEPSLVTKLLELRGRKDGWKPLEKNDVQKLGYKDLNELGDSLASGKVTLNKLKGIKPSLGLPPPRKGFKRSTRRMYTQGGILGENPELSDIVEAMLAPR